MNTYKQRFIHKFQKPGVLAICVLTIMLLSNQPTLALYQPSPDQKPPSGHTDSSGVR